MSKLKRDVRTVGGLVATAIVLLSSIAEAAMPARPQALATVRVWASQWKAEGNVLPVPTSGPQGAGRSCAPGHPLRSGCCVKGQWYPEGARVAIDPGPMSLIAAPIHVFCKGGLLCYPQAPQVCVKY